MQQLVKYHSCARTTCRWNARYVNTRVDLHWNHDQLPFCMPDSFKNKLTCNNSMIWVMTSRKGHEQVVWEDRSSLSKPVQYFFVCLWVFMLASIPFAIPIMDQRHPKIRPWRFGVVYLLFDKIRRPRAIKLLCYGKPAREILIGIVFYDCFYCVAAWRFLLGGPPRPFFAT